jgi:hypothetical protein
MQALTLQHQSGRPCVKELLRIAQGDSGGSRRIASVLLSLWSGDSFQCDLQGLLCLDGNRLQQVLMLIVYLHQQGLQLDCLVSEQEMNPILDMWGARLQPREATTAVGPEGAPTIRQPHALTGPGKQDSRIKDWPQCVWRPMQRA